MCYTGDQRVKVCLDEARRVRERAPALWRLFVDIARRIELEEAGLIHEKKYVVKTK